MVFIIPIVHVISVFDNIFSRCVLVHRRIAIIVSINIIVTITYTIVVVDTIAIIVVDPIVVIIMDDSIIILSAAADFEPYCYNLLVP